MAIKAKYTFNSLDSSDSSGNGHNGSDTNMSYQTGRYGGSAVFNGSARIDITHSTDFNFGTGDFAIHIIATFTSDNWVIISKMTSKGGASGRNIQKGPSGANKYNLTTWENNSNSALTSANTYSSETSVDLVFIRKANGDIEIWRDGILIDSSSGNTVRDTDDTGNVAIGLYNLTDSLFFIGSTDEVTLRNDAPTAGQINNNISFRKGLI